jgi:hypothetical protein
MKLSFAAERSTISSRVIGTGGFACNLYPTGLPRFFGGAGGTSLLCALLVAIVRSYTTGCGVSSTWDR